MRKIVTILALMLMCAVHAMAQGSAAAVGRVARYVEQLGSYDAQFDIEAEGFEASGSYAVAGDVYHIKLQQAEVFSDGKCRYEVDHERKEVNIDVVDLSSRNVLDNPTRCFDFVGEDYDVEIVDEAAERVTLRITAREDAFEGEIYLTADLKGKPLQLEYKLYDDIITVKVTSIASRKSKIASYSQSMFKDYDVIDFR